MAVAFLALALFYGAIHSIQDLGATLLILIILAVVGLWSVLRHINASITSDDIALNENLLNYRITIRFEDISDVFPYTGSYAPKPSIYCFADRQKDWANRVVCIYGDR